MAFTLSNPPGGSLTAAQAAINDLFPCVDVSVGTSDTANKIMTAGELLKLTKLIRPDGSALKTPPLAADIGTTWTNVNSGTYTQLGDGSLNVTKAQSGGTDNWTLLVKTLPARPVSWTVEFDLAFPLVNYQSFGLVYRDSSTSKFVVLDLTCNSGSFGGGIVGLAGYNYTNNTTYSGAATGLTYSSALPSYRFLRLQDNGTNLIAYWSNDGISWKQLGAGVSRTAFLTTPDQIGFGYDPASGSTWTDTPGVIIRDFYTS